MAGPKSSSEAAGQQHGASYKDTLMAPSSHDDLSNPNQQEKPKLPPVEDAGSPPMVPETPAGPTGGATSSSGEDSDPSTSTKATTPDNEGFIPVGKAATQASDDGSSSGGKGELTESKSRGDDNKSSPTPPSAAATLSAVDAEAVSDPSTADLVAAATGATPSDTPAVNTSTPFTNPGGDTLLAPLPDSPDNQLAKGHVDSTQAGDSAAAKGGSNGGGSAAAEEGISGQGAKGASSGAAAGGGAGDSINGSSDVSLPTPAAAAKMAGGDETASPGAAAVSDERAKAVAGEELPERGGEGDIITPADFAATGLAALEAEADAAAGWGGGAGGGSSADRSSSVMTDRTDSGWYDRSYSGILGHASAAFLAGMDPVREQSEDPDSHTEGHSSEQAQQDDAKGVSGGPPQSYPALAQALAVSDDAAAVPAPPEPSVSDSKSSAAPPDRTAQSDSSAGQQQQEGGGGDAGNQPLPLAETAAPRVFAGMGSGKESGRGSVTIAEPAAEEPTPPAAAAEAPAGEKNESEGGEKSEDPSLPFPLKAAGDAAEAMIDVVGDAAEAVKDTLIGTDM